MGKYKLLEYYENGSVQLFDLEKDPNELNNLAGNPKHQDKLTELRTELKRWATAQGDDLQPHRDPYLTSAPIPEIKRKPKKKKPKPE